MRAAGRGLAVVPMACWRSWARADAEPAVMAEILDHGDGSTERAADGVEVALSAQPLEQLPLGGGASATVPLKTSMICIRMRLIPKSGQWHD